MHLAIDCRCIFSQYERCRSRSSHSYRSVSICNHKFNTPPCMQRWCYPPQRAQCASHWLLAVLWAQLLWCAISTTTLDPWWEACSSVRTPASRCSLPRKYVSAPVRRVCMLCNVSGRNSRIEASLNSGIEQVELFAALLTQEPGLLAGA